MDADSGIIGSVEASRILDVNPSTITRYVHDGRLTPIMRGTRGKRGSFLFRLADVEALLPTSANTGQ